MDNESKVESVVYSEKEKEYYAKLVKYLCQMRDDRDQKHPELDDMTYLEYFDSNRRKDLSYIPPKKNRQDIRIVTGTTREKDTTLLSTMLNLNLEADVVAFDKEDMIVNELGDNIGELVKKSREIEMYDQFKSNIYRELISQGDVFVEEVYITKHRDMPTDPIKWTPASTDFELDYKTKKEPVYDGCTARMITGRKVFLGSVRIEYMNKQPRAAIVNVLTRDQARSIYGKWARWKNVPITINTVGNDILNTDSKTYKTWNISALKNTDEIYEIKYFDKENNRFMILLNGVMMLPYNYPLTAYRPDGEIPISQGKLEVISDFAYSKSQPSKVKVDQEVLDEATKLIVEAFRLGRKPPMGNRSKKVMSPSVFMAGEITNDIKKDQLFPLIENAGINASEFSFYQLFKGSIDDKTQNSTYSGETPEGNPTATQIIEEKNQQLLKLGAAIDGVVALEKQMVWHRIHDILVNWTKEVDQKVDDVKGGLKNIYRQLSLKTQVETGEQGYKIFKMANEDEFPPMEYHMAEEERLSKVYNMPVRIVYLNPKELASLKYRFYVTVVPQPKTNDNLSKLVFVQNIREAVELFGPEALNQEYLKQRYAIMIGENYNKMFRKMDIMSMIKMGMGPNGSMEQGGGMGANMQNKGMQKRKQLKPAVE